MNIKNYSFITLTKRPSPHAQSSKRPMRSSIEAGVGSENTRTCIQESNLIVDAVRKRGFTSILAVCQR